VRKKTSKRKREKKSLAFLVQGPTVGDRNREEEYKQQPLVLEISN